MSNTNLKPIIIVVVVGLVLGGLILNWDNSGPAEDGHNDSVEHVEDLGLDDHGHVEHQKGPRGGWLFTTNKLGVEVMIYEKGVPSQFRIYLYEDGKPLPPTAAEVIITVSRLGQSAQSFQFRAESDYLIGDGVVEEPHSFDLEIEAEWNGEIYSWEYSQIEARVEMSDASLKRSGINIKKAKPATIKPVLRLPGKIAFNHHSLVKIVPRVSGIVTKVMRHLGEEVNKGEVLAVIESQALAELRSQYLAARKRVQLARTTYAREKMLWEEKITAQQDYLAAQQILSETKIELDLVAAKLQALGVKPDTSIKKNLAQYEIVTPISGVVVTKHIVLGEVVDKNTEIFTLADMSTMYVDLIVYPKDLAIIHKGQPAIINATASDARGEGQITYVSAFIDPQTQAAKAHIVLDNIDRIWKAGMFVTAELSTQFIQVPIAVSNDAIQILRDWSVVFGRYGEYFEARPLKLGRRDGKMVEVLDGLSVGEEYASGNSFAIKAELGKSGASHDH